MYIMTLIIAIALQPRQRFVQCIKGGNSQPVTDGRAAKTAPLEMRPLPECLSVGLSLCVYYRKLWYQILKCSIKTTPISESCVAFETRKYRRLSLAREQNNGRWAVKLAFGRLPLLLTSYGPSALPIGRRRLRRSLSLIRYLMMIRKYSNY